MAMIENRLSPGPQAETAGSAAQLIAAIAAAEDLDAAIWIARRDLQFVLAPDFLPQFLAHLSGPRLMRIRLRMAYYALGPALYALPPQQLHAPGLALALLLGEHDAASFIGRYHHFIDAGFFAYASDLIATLRERPDVHPAVAGDFADSLARAIDGLGQMWAAQLLDLAPQDPLSSGPVVALREIVARVRGDLPPGWARLAGLHSYFSQTANPALCHPAFLAWALATAIALVADIPAADDAALADILRHEGLAVVVAWAGAARTTGRAAASQEFAILARLLAWESSDNLLWRVLQSRNEDQLKAAVRAEPLLLHPGVLNALTDLPAIVMPGDAENIIGRLDQLRSDLLRESENPIMALAGPIERGELRYQEAAALVTGAEASDMLATAAVDALLAGGESLYHDDLARLNHLAAQKRGQPLLEAATAITLAARIGKSALLHNGVLMAEKALDVGRAARRLLLQQRALQTLSILATWRGDHDAARRYYQEEYRVALQLPPHFGRIAALLDLAGLAAEDGDLTRAALYLALLRHYRLSEQAGEAALRYYLLLADLESQKGDAEAAMQLWRQAARLARKLPDPLFSSLLAAHRGSDGKADAGPQGLRQAIAVALEHGEYRLALDLRFRLALLLASMGQALDFIDEHANYRTLLDRARFGGFEAQTLLLRGRLLVLLGRPLLALEALRPALALARAGARRDLVPLILSDLVRCHLALNESEAAAVYLRDLRTLRPRLPQPQSRRDPGSGSVDAAVARIERARQRGDPFGRPLQAAGIRTMLAGMTSTAFVYLDVQSAGGLAHVVTASGAERIPIPLSLREVNEMLANLRVEAPRLSDADAAGGWSEQVFNQESFALALQDVVARLAELTAPLLDYLETLEVGNLILAPASLLSALPLHALPMHGGTLLDRYNVSYAPSATALAGYMQRAADATSANLPHWSAIAGSAFANYPVAAAGLLARLEREYGSGALYWAGEVAPENVAVASRLLHIHLHGTPDPDAADRTMIALGARHGQKPGASDIGRLTATAVAGSLVVLAVCEGAAAPARLTHDFVGLAAAFLDAGAAAVLAAPWRLNEPATSLLLGRFYQELAGGSNVAVALRVAQLWLRDLSRHDAVLALRELAQAARDAAIAPVRESAAAGRIFERLAALFDHEETILNSLLRAYHSDATAGATALWELCRKLQGANTTSGGGRMGELAAALWREQQAHNGDSSYMVARLTMLLTRPFYSPYYWAGLKAIGAASAVRIPRPPG